MKFRTDFVTNSSSSSFVTININNPLLASVLSKYEELLGNDDCMEVVIYNDNVEINNEEGFMSMPSKKENMVDALIGALTGEGYYDDGEYNEEYDDAYFDEADWRAEMVKELKENKEELTKQTTYAEFSYCDYGWQGDSESRYEKEKYDKETLDEIYSSIAEEQGKHIDEVTYDDFCEYVSNMTSIEEDTFVYTQKNDKVKITHSFTLE